MLVQAGRVAGSSPRQQIMGKSAQIEPRWSDWSRVSPRLSGVWGLAKGKAGTVC